MTKFKKIGEIHGYKQDNIKEVAETLEKQGFVVVDDNELEESWKTYHILRESVKADEILILFGEYISGGGSDRNITYRNQ